MKKHILLFTLFIAICSGKILAQESPLGHQTLLWKVTGNNLEKPSYLFGTIHMVCTDSFELSPNVSLALDASDTLVLELDISNPDAVAQIVMANSLSTDSLSSGLSVADKTLLAKQLGLLGMPLDKVELLKPYVLSMMITQSIAPPCPITSVEQVITNRWDNEEAMSYLESPEEQIAAMEKAIDRLTLLKTLESLSDMPKELQQLMRFYQSGEIDSIQSIMFSEESATENFIEFLLINRNEKWVQQFKTFDQAKSYFLAVGAGHLPGEKGLIELMRDAGYTVTPIML
jgi:uncharacterized protein YbaP (TraB family)